MITNIMKVSLVKEVCFTQIIFLSSLHRRSVYLKGREWLSAYSSV